MLCYREYSLARAYIETTCTVRNVTYTGSDLLCTYCSGGKERIGLRTGKLPATTQDNRDDSTYHSRHISTSPGGAAVTIGAACVSSQFPCIRVLVVYEAVDGVHYEAVLHPDSLQAAGLYSQVRIDR